MGTTLTAPTPQADRHRLPLLGVRLDPPVVDAVKALAEEQGRTTTDMLQEAALWLLEHYGHPMPAGFPRAPRVPKAHRHD